jgi:hypothetical protein
VLKALGTVARVGRCRHRWISGRGNPCKKEGDARALWLLEKARLL